MVDGGRRFWFGSLNKYCTYHMLLIGGDAIHCPTTTRQRLCVYHRSKKCWWCVCFLFCFLFRSSKLIHRPIDDETTKHASTVGGFPPKGKRSVILQRKMLCMFRLSLATQKTDLSQKPNRNTKQTTLHACTVPLTSLLKNDGRNKGDDGAG